MTVGSGETVRVALPGALEAYADGRRQLDIEATAPATLRAVLDRIRAELPALDRRLRDEQGTLRRHVNVFVGGDNARDLDGLDTVIPPGAEVFVAPAVSGG